MNLTHQSLIRLIAEKFNIDISIFSENFVESAFANRMNLLNTNSITDYQQKLISDAEESEILLKSLSNSYSTFFRNALTFSLLHQVILPKIISEKTKNNDAEIRIWSAGCAAGQEPYSLAILLEDLMKVKPSEFRYHIFATDNADAELLSAGLGIYEFDAIQNAPYRFIKQYFVKTGSHYAIREKLKTQISFSHYDLSDTASLAPPASIYGDFDLVMCSNVLFYYTPEIQQRFLEKFRNTMRKGSFFITGEAETGILNSATGFRNYIPSSPIYIRI